MRVGVVRTVGSPCRCAESVAEALRTLGHEMILADSGSIEMDASALAENCHLVIDHTDTYCGRGLYRPFVRLLLESCGARVLGSTARACFVADNKAGAKQILSNAGIPVPPGIVIYSNPWTLPPWLKPPLIIKPAFEHMSRGLSLVRTEQEAYKEAGQLLETLRQPVLVESYIAGREMAVALVGNASELQVLPAVEWKTRNEILTEDFKLMDPEAAEHLIVPANLDSELNRDLEYLARKAFEALELRDYARFDIRLSRGGSIYFLEANTTPSFEPREALALSAECAGLDYAGLVARLLSTAQQRYSLPPAQKPHTLRVTTAAVSLDLDIPEEVHSPPESTIELAGLMDVQLGDDVLELGCGSGLLTVAAAKMGARRVVATDIDPKALRATLANAGKNSVSDIVEVRAGSWYEALEDGALSDRRPLFDVIIATPPQTPGPHPFGPKYGGADGISHLARIIQEAPQYLKPSEGRLWLLAISLANPQETWKMLEERFGEVNLVQKSDRPFTEDEYNSLDAGLFGYLRWLRSSGLADFVEMDDGRCCFQNLFIRAAKPGRS